MLRITSFNCNSVRNNCEIVKELLKNNDIVMLQELMLLQSDVNFLSELHCDFDFIYGLKDENFIGIPTGRPSKGVAIFYKKCYSSLIKPIRINEWLNGIVFQCDIGNVLLLNVYFPYDNNSLDSLDDYRSALSLLDLVLIDSNIFNICIMGDFNADPNKGRFWRELQNFILSKYRLLTDVDYLSEDTFSYLSPAHNTTSWLDHALLSKSIYDKISNCCVNYDLSLYDHFPLQLDLCLCLDIVEQTKSFDIRKFINWDSIKKSDLDKYQSNLENYLKNNDNYDVFNCNGCNKSSHINELKIIYEFITDVILKSSDEITITKKSTFKIVPGWNDNVKNYYRIARNKFIAWLQAGKPLFGVELSEMKESRKHFKNALNFCKKHNEKIVKDKIVNAMYNKSTKEFWKEIRNMQGSNKKVNVSNVVDGENDPDIIVDKFSNFYKGIFHSQSYSVNDEDCFLPEGNNFDVFKINIDTLKNSVLKLKPYLGHDNLHSNHIKNLPDNFLRFILNFINGCLSHFYVPHMMSKGIIKPLIKDKYGDISALSNYRPIMSSTIILKLFEHILLEKVKNCFISDDRQHGYKKKYSTATACLVLKETILNYFNHDTPVFAAFVDFSKAFDKVDHSILCKKLIKLGFPRKFVQILFNWYRSQYVQVLYESKYSSIWKINNGVRQGGILSPLLFTVYIDNILKLLVNSNCGCMLGVSRSNVIAYADDLVLLSPSLNGLKTLLKNLMDGAENIKLDINFNKTVCIKFHNKYKNEILNDIKINDKIIKFVKEIKYLGFHLCFNLCNKNDIIQNLNQFYKQFNTVIRKFKNCDLNLILKLFKTYCLQIYGSSLWFNNFNCTKVFNQFAVAYHKAIKKILCVPYYSSNHECCEVLNLLTFKHFINFNKLRFIHNIFNSPCDFIYKNFSFLKNYSKFYNECEHILSSVYSVHSDLISNDIDAILSRIYFINYREEYSLYYSIFN